MIWLLLLVLVCAGPLFVFLLSRVGTGLRRRAAEPLPLLPDGSWPTVGLIVPAAGNHPAMEPAIRSLLSQIYPGRVVPVMVTASDDEPAARLARRLQEDFPTLEHVVAGIADGCGQKNHNSLSGVAHLGDRVEVFAFCDSTHLASPDFLQRIMAPIACGEAAFTTGYHEVVPQDEEFVTLSYTLCVLVMRLLQAVGRFTQPWGGAMGIRRSLFEEKGIGRFWATNVVDDCSLTTFLASAGVNVRLCPGALLRTRAGHHDYDVWRAWLDRQILFLKFCVPAQWVPLGILSGLVAVAPLVAALGLLGLVVFHPVAPLLAVTFVYLALSALATARLRPLVSHHVRMIRWLGAYFLTCCVFFRSFMATVPSKGILWHGIWYKVGPAGRVLETRRDGKH